MPNPLVFLAMAGKAAGKAALGAGKKLGHTAMHLPEAAVNRAKNTQLGHLIRHGRGFPGLVGGGQVPAQAQTPPAAGPQPIPPSTPPSAGAEPDSFRKQQIEVLKSILSMLGPNSPERSKIESQLRQLGSFQ